MIDLTDFPLTGTGSCVVSDGKCQIKTTVNTELGAGTLVAGENTSITLEGVGLALPMAIGYLRRASGRALREYQHGPTE